MCPRESARLGKINPVKLAAQGASAAKEGWRSGSTSGRLPLHLSNVEN